MKKIFSFLILLIFISCIRDVDNSNDICTTNCTQIRGQVSRDDGTGIEGIELIFRYEHNQTLSNYNRTIDRVRTDENGFYEMNVFLNDNEIGNSGGNFFLELSFDELEIKLNDNFLKPSDFIFNNEKDFFLISNIQNRDEVFEINYNVPFKSNNLNISLNNFTPIQESDYFLYNLYVPYGFPENYIAPKQEQRFAEEVNNTYIASNIIGLNKIVVIRKKDGIQMDRIEQYINVINNNDNYEIGFEY